MRKFIFLMLIAMPMLVGAQALSQQGLVKTKGRMVNGRHVAGHGDSYPRLTYAKKMIEEVESCKETEEMTIKEIEEKLKTEK